MNNDGNICCEFGEGVKIKVNTNVNLSPMLLPSSKCQNLAHNGYKLLKVIKYVTSLGSLFEFFICGHSKLINKFNT